jgi:hypothetical protein
MPNPLSNWQQTMGQKQLRTDKSLTGGKKNNSEGPSKSLW